MLGWFHGRHGAPKAAPGSTGPLQGVIHIGLQLGSVLDSRPAAPGRALTFVLSVATSSVLLQASHILDLENGKPLPRPWSGFALGEEHTENP